MLKKSLFLLAACAIVLTGCTDEELAPVVTQDTLLFGAFPRLQELRAAEFDLADLAGSAYSMTVDFVDNAGGDLVGQYNVYVAFDDNNPDNGDLSTETMLWKSFTAADFSAQSTGNLGLDVEIPFSEIAAFVGAGNAGDVISGDRFLFRTEIVHSDGRVFSSDNSTPAITNAFGGIWNFNVNATCPLADDQFAGDYAVEYGTVYDEFALFGAPVQALGNPPLNLTVTLGLVSGSTTRRVFNVGTTVNPGYGFGASDTTLEFACDIVTSTAIDSGAGCGGGSIAAVQVAADPFDLNDDSTWTINYVEYGDNDGGCGVAAMEYSLVFSKQ
ncbi:hypothetical protein [Lewinella sp. W8]|uniref:hypothetical protein n=1 Tax=Lewinella sp. W8 TaxID=2528208 RepID=UPI001068589A|nr:hypothetical protein [Lewinella sp. W8]MTB51807.1 hypothetical protein [Lewinella sp. W8]